MIENMLDKKLKHDLKKEYEPVPESVRIGIEAILRNLPERRECATLISLKRRRRLRQAAVACCLIVSLGIGGILSAPVWAANFMASQAQEHNKYVVYDGHYYRANGEQIKEPELGKQIGEVLRAGNWQLVQDGDSNEFAPSTPLYKIDKVNESEKIAVKVSLGQINFLSAYIVLERQEAVVQPDHSQINHAKNDPTEVGIALDNIRERAPEFAEFIGLEERLEANLVKFDPDRGATIYYSLPEADIHENGSSFSTQGVLFIYQYKEGDVENFPQSAFSSKMKSTLVDNGKAVIREPDLDYAPPQPKETFIIGETEWSYYSDQLWCGHRDGMYYEIQTQGNVTKSLMLELLPYFKPREAE